MRIEGKRGGSYLFVLLFIFAKDTCIAGDSFALHVLPANNMQKWVVSTQLKITRYFIGY